MRTRRLWLTLLRLLALGVHETRLVGALGHVDADRDQVGTSLLSAAGRHVAEEAGTIPGPHEAPTALLVTCGKTHNLLIGDRSKGRGSSLSFEAQPSGRNLAAPASPSSTLPCSGQG